MKFTKRLAIIGFEINPSDLYISNKAIDGSQMKLWFNIYNCKLIRHKRKANDRMIKCICQEYESIFEDGSGKMEVSWGTVYEYLLITLDYTAHGKVSITIFSYIEDIITAFDKADPKGKGKKSSAATNTIFAVNKYCKKLISKKLWISTI